MMRFMVSKEEEGSAEVPCTAKRPTEADDAPADSPADGTAGGKRRRKNRVLDDEDEGEEAAAGSAVTPAPAPSALSASAAAAPAEEDDEAWDGNMGEAGKAMPAEADVDDEEAEAIAASMKAAAARKAEAAEPLAPAEPAAAAEPAATAEPAKGKTKAAAAPKAGKAKGSGPAAKAAAKKALLDARREKEASERAERDAAAPPPAEAAEAALQEKPPAAPAAPQEKAELEPVAAVEVAEGEGEGEEEEEDDDEAEDEGAEAKGGPSSRSTKPKAKMLSKAQAKAAAAVGAAYHKYDPLKAATWKAGEEVPYLFLARVFGDIEEESKRLIITEKMANAFRTVIATSPDQLITVMSLAVNRLAADYEGVELGIGDQIMIKAVSESCGRSEKAIKAQVGEEGDLGLVALSSRAKQVTLSKPKALTANSVFKTLTEIAKISGNEAMKRKKDKIKNMLVAAQEKEAQYIVRSLQGKMRIGLAEQTALVALAHAIVLTRPPGRTDATHPKPPRGEALQERLHQAECTIKQAYSEMPNYGIIIPALLEHGMAQLHEHAALTAGIPVKPMLAKPTKGIGEVLDRMSAAGAFTCEYKYDGERAQIHMLEDGTIRIFSRNSEDNSTKYPDIAELIPRAVKAGVTSFIIDAEAVAVDGKTGAIQPFQVLSTRKRKDASVDDIAVRVCVFAFDLIYLNGVSLLKEPFSQRRAKLHASFAPMVNEFSFAISSDASDVEAIQEFLTESIKGNCEGLMVKTLDTDATYEPSRRSLNWLKVKKDYLQGMGDSCDLVPIGGYLGKGKRTGVYGAYLLACYNDEEEAYETVCKIGTGFSDANLELFTTQLNEKTIDAPRAYYRVPDNWAAGQLPDVWFEPAQVWEVLAADLSISPVHTGGMGIVDPAKGIALRFPRFLRVRDDKGVEDATNSQQIADMYNNQATTKGPATHDDDDDY